MSLCKKVLEPLARAAAGLLCPGELPKCVWRQQSPSAIVPAKLLGQRVTARAAQQQAGDAAAQEALARSGASRGSGASKADLMLVVERGGQQKVVCIGEVKRVPILVRRDGAPLDLLIEARGSKATAAKQTLRQLYTYMVEFDSSYGFVTCWDATTLVCVTPAARGRPQTIMWISPPIGADSIQPYTLLRALAWKQHQALLRAFERPSASPVLHGGVQQGGDEGGGEGGRDQAGDGGSGRGGGRRGGGSRSRSDGGRGGGGDGGFEASQASGGPTPSPEVRKRGQEALAGALLLRDSASPEPAGAPGCMSTTGGQVAGPVADQPAPQPAAAPERGTVQLEFRDVVAEGRDGTVFEGLCDGEPAIIKVYTWEEPQLAAYWCEVLTYRALAGLQGSLVPEVLAHGQLSDAMRFLAMRAVPHSRTLSDWEGALPPAVKAAALHALDAAHAACAGFVHGDVRPENILVLGSGLAEGGGSGPDLPRCMLLDLGSSRLDGTPQEQAEERRELEALLAESS